ncbi:hypothetical protein, partial [Paenibacillus xylanexedens]|uniref:hypothetical protein n=1 Tax=Paenibacillus xylanexedens TaxID=528191 RepID=UPI001C9315C0
VFAVAVFLMLWRRVVGIVVGMWIVRQGVDVLLIRMCGVKRGGGGLVGEEVEGYVEGVGEGLILR